jgi:integrase
MNVPSLKLHKGTGQAYVVLDGKRRYLGKHGTPQATSEYIRTIGEWEARERQAAAPSSADLTVVELTDRFWAHAQKYYAAPGGGLANEAKHFKTVCDAMNAMYARTLAKDFGPLAFKAVRHAMLKTTDQRGDKTGLRCRRYVNQLAARIRRIYRWAVAEELVPPAALVALQAVPGLKRGRCEAPDTEPVTPVADAIVDETMKYMTPTVAAMVELQRLTGMRPGELCIMRTCDINTGGKVWTYKPSSHKTENRGRTRIVYIGPKAQAVLEPRLRKELTAFIFSPADSERERLEARHAARVTSESCGNVPGSNRKRHPKRTPGDRYDTGSYAKAVTYACMAAFGDDKSKHWRPHRLRHTFATTIRREHGLTEAQVLLGHAEVSTTQVYAEADEQKAVQVIARIG